jgi:rhodanese-related sulfurtransferase/quercetin dioxygenase-like cupin family protein
MTLVRRVGLVVAAAGMMVQLAAAAEHTTESLATIRANVEQGKAVLVDVRGEHEWEAGHVEGAIFLPINEVQDGLSEEELGRLPKDKVLYTYCVVGKRALTVGNELEKRGYTVRVIKPGYKELIAAGFKKADEEEETHDEGISLYPESEIQWKDGPPSLPKGAKIAVLEGDPGKEGPFVFRVKVPDGYRIPPHTHPKMERVTVISGVFNIGMGAKFDQAATKAMPAGTYGYWEPGMKHFVWTKGETVAQFHGMGPWVIHYVNPADDPRTQKQE